MIEIGKSKKVRLTTGFGKNAKPVVDAQGQPVVKTLPGETWRITREKLNGHFGGDHGRRLIVGMLSGDVLVLRPEGRLRRTAEVTIALADVYSYCLRSQALGRQLERARARKAAKQARLASRRIQAADRRLTRSYTS